MNSIKKLELDHLIGKEVGTVTILKELARGGSAVVFIAYQRTLKRQIALKVLPKSLMTPETAERFQMEAEAAAILSHPNIIPIYEVGETDDFLYFAMQLIHGRSAAHYIQAAQKHVLPSRRILPVETTVYIVIKVLDALEYAHGQDIIHRDIKPSNVLIETHSKRPIILDFGIAKVSRGLDKATSIIQGTPVYMPPEQIRNEPVDGRADIYATGVMLFEMLVSNLPLPGYRSMELLLMKLQKKDHLFQKKPSEMNKMIHPDMDRIVLKAISFDPENRFANCREFREHLEEFQDRYLRKKKQGK
jgi:serine/threonine protein kinase